jgi:hypothetical protein
MNRISKIKLSRTVIRDEHLNSLDVPKKIEIQQKNEKDTLFIESNAPLKFSACICMVLSGDLSYKKIDSLARLRSYFKETHIIFTASGLSEDALVRSVNYSTVIDLKTSEEYILRNAYIEFIRKNKDLFKFMIVIDDQLLENEIKLSSLNCFKMVDDWDAVFGNQSYKYYDIENLLTSETQPYHEEIDLAKKNELRRILQYHIPSDIEPIPVMSAYGGFAIYKIDMFPTNLEYKPDGHKSFNILFNKRMFIWTSLILRTPPSLSSLYV